MASVISVPANKLPSASMNASSTSEQMVTDTATTAAPIFLPLPVGGELVSTTGKKSAHFKLRAWGRVTTGASTNVTFKIYTATSLTSTTIVAGNLLATSGTQAYNTVSGNFYAECNITLDTTSQKLQGWFFFANNALAPVGPTTLSTALTADGDSTTPIGFVIGVTHSASNASNLTILDGFVLESVREG